MASSELKELAKVCTEVARGASEVHPVAPRAQSARDGDITRPSKLAWSSSVFSQEQECLRAAHERTVRSAGSPPIARLRVAEISTRANHRQIVDHALHDRKN